MKVFLFSASVVLLSLVSLAAEAPQERLTGPNTLIGKPYVEIYQQDRMGLPSFVVGQLSDPAREGDEPGIALDFFDQNRTSFGISSPSEELKLRSSERDELGMIHIRFDQYYESVRVMGGDMGAHFTAEGVLRVVNGTFRPLIAVDAKPGLSEQEAVVRAQTDLESFFGKGHPSPPELVIFPWDDRFYLCWRLFLYSETPLGRWEYLVDAHSGEIIFNANRIMNANDVGTGIGVMGAPRTHIDTDFDGAVYQMRDYTRQRNNDPHGHGGLMPDGNFIQTNFATGFLPGVIAADEDNVWSVGSLAPAVDGHVYSSLIYDYMLNDFGRNGYDDSGASMLTVVNYSAEGDNNAYWDGSRIVIWSWSTGWRSLAGCPDVMAHEWAHAITENCSDLVYQLESGALSESFSDMFGTAFEFAHDTLDPADWLLGENGVIGGAGFRDMADPHAFSDPDYYGSSDPYWVNVEGCSPVWANDYCGVHTNSGVGNKWFHLLSEGGSHHGVSVTGIGIQNAISIAYRANRFYWTTNTGYETGAQGTVLAAADLDSTGVWLTQVIKAWQAVGVPTPGPLLTFHYPAGIPTMLMPHRPTTFEVVVTGILGADPMAGSGRLFHSIDGGAWQNVAMVEISPDHYEATLPSLECGASIEFYVRAQTAALQYYYNPDTTAPHVAAPITGIVVGFADNFESDRGWTVSGDATFGHWERGLPQGLGDRGDPLDDFDGSGQCYLTQNLAGNSDVDDGTTILTSPVINIGGDDGIVHYARWYSNDEGTDPNNDEMQVYISNDSGSNWTLAESVGPSLEAGGGWYEVDFWISEYVSLTEDIRLRFDVSDLNDPSVVEGGLDDVTVTVYACEVVAPVIITDSLPVWSVGVAFSEQLEAAGGTGPLVWSDKNDNLLGTGLALSETGLVLGVPAGGGTIFFTALVTDSLLESDEKLLALQINAAVKVTADTLPDWTVGIPYSVEINTTGGTGQVIITDRDDDLTGTGLSLSSEGLLSGTPNSTGPISFTARAVDEVGSSDEKGYGFTVNDSLTILDDSLMDGIEGIAYAHQLTVTGGTGTILWSEASRALDGTGLALGSDGLLSGTPVASGPISFTAQVVDSIGASDTGLISLNIIAGVQITTDSVPTWTVGVVYAEQLIATGGVAELSWIDSGDGLAGTGLALSGTGLLSGTPIVTGGLGFTVEASGTGGTSDTKALVLTINDSVQIAAAVLPDWTVGADYSQQLEATGGTGVLSFTDLNDDLAGTGLNLDSAGWLTGVPTIVGPVSFVGHVNDEVGGSDQDTFAFVVNPALQITTTSVPDGAVDSLYGTMLTSGGGTGQLTWLDKNDDLVGSGLALSELGELNGTPLASGQITLTALVRDEGGGSDEIVLQFTVFGILKIETSGLPPWTIGCWYEEALIATGGRGAHTWSDRDSALVGTGLTLDSTGLLSGLIANEGVISFTARVADTAGGQADQAFDITVNPALQILTAALPDWTVGVPLLVQLDASGGTGAIEFTVDVGDPAAQGLSLLVSGEISGTPSVVGTLHFTALAIDQGGDSAIQGYTFEINAQVNILTDSLPRGREGQAYSEQLLAEGGTGLRTFVDKSGDLVGTGLTMTNDGLISGMPTQGQVSFVVVLSDAVGSVHERVFTFDVSPVWLCGDVNNDGTGPDIGDLTWLVTYMFQGGEAPAMMETTDVDGSGTGPDIGDLTWLVVFMFQGGADLNCSGTYGADRSGRGSSNSR